MNSDFPVLDFSTPRSISPTDIGAFGRLEGCERFLRLRLHSANDDANWLERAGLQKQAIPPLLTSSGAAFEEIVERAIEAEGPRVQFLNEAIYQADGINYHSKQVKTLDARPHADDFSAAVLAPDHPIVLIEHDEAASILENASEERILRPLLEQLTGAYALDAGVGLGIVVPHRAQRALLADERWKVDTVERFQGDQRRVMAFSATESDPTYLLSNGGFLLDPRRLCVSLSRAKEKLILVAAKSVFDLVPLDEETFLNAQLWQKLRHDFCTHELWQGEVGGAKVRVLGSGLGD